MDTNPSVDFLMTALASQATCTGDRDLRSAFASSNLCATTATTYPEGTFHAAAIANEANLIVAKKNSSNWTSNDAVDPDLIAPMQVPRVLVQSLLIRQAYRKCSGEPTRARGKRHVEVMEKEMGD